MPGFDGTGPQGRGPTRGDGRGCRNARGRRPPAGRGRCASGDGFRRGFGPRRGDADGRFEPSSPLDPAALEAEADILRERLAAIGARRASTKTP